MSESVAVDERRVAPTFDYPRLERWPRRELWAAEAAMTLVIGAVTAVLLAAEDDLRPRKLIWLTFMATLVWLFTLHGGAAFARARGLGSMLGAVLGTGAGLIVLSLLNFWILTVLIPPRRLLLMAGAALVVSFVFQAFASDRFSKPRRVLVVGADQAAQELVHDLIESPSKRYRCVGLIDASPNGQAIDGFVYPARRTGDFIEIVRRQAPELIVCSKENVRTSTVDRLLDAGVTTVGVVNTFDFYESAFGRVANQRMTKAWFTSVLDAGRGGYPTRTKRALDVAVATLALVITLPLFIAIAIAVRCSGRGPILYRQVRSGEGGKLFTIVKFRTMVADAEREGAVWASEDDDRITPVGRHLRRTRLDEIPQFWNVVRGDMSIVGPRPERPEYLDYLQREIRFWNRRLLLKPGITGWAQVHHAYTADVRGAARKLAYDLYYLKHRSLGLDLLIAYRTFKIVISGRGAR